MSTVQPSPDPMSPALRVLKVFVIVAGVVLIFGTIAFFVLLAKKRSADLAALEERQEGPPVAVALPTGSSLADLRLDGDRALLILDGADGARFLLWLDLETGQRLSLLRLDD